MEDKIYEEQYKIIKALLATTTSALRISKTLCEHDNTDILTGDHVICGLVYRLMTPMSEEEMNECLCDADKIMDSESSEEDDSEIDIVEDEDKENNEERKVRVNNCNCDICMQTRICMLNFNDYVCKDEWGDKIKESIKVACQKYNRYI